ncbi:MAG TPA: pilus assembly protein TadB, partial [Gemmataceae bacterium]|nr:pilus assembly protein TadB [Gemmataceae bacterium]
MDPLILAFVVFFGVAGLVGAVSFLVLRMGSPGRTADRLDALVGRGSRGSKDSSTDLMIKQALMEVGKQNILERLTPEFFRVSKMFEQADLKMKPSALFGIALGLALVGGLISTLLVNMYVAPVGASILFSLPFIWLWYKRASRLKKFASQLPEAMELVARALRA